ncbi:phage tail tape measure protein [Salmonella enterica]|uniref:Bacteriophage tail tape measure N-terminal domain-containing protein n=1 Tax=Salmonella enterica subsp. enterica serovar Kentucky TaxID=192955 RepID=A0A5W2RJ86_SALET|nr:phage tail length tape measure family protein [Salmonella enterica]EBW5074603.1 hypothetical protein [Salmonella enterica subsp. enterica serovar Kentucky]EDA8949063.1 hypothetical protein [Salmonella enterica subsp. enterica serovar Altona]MCL9618683.1 phage tail length tape measure family protein [Salmonella enterica subsp. enterica serovar Enteritidis]EDA1716949.1 hypothetical protein [Salmonella enterica subsp. enterica serovar Kentucky]EDY2511814.1 hypothetical protein [Salmonella ente
MAQEENVGSIVYTIDADVAPLLKGGQQANAVLAEIEASIDANIAQFKKMDTQVSATAQAVSQSTRSFGGLQNALRQSGYQVQDFIVQVQGGQSALVALSQQGSQLLGVFGAGGAVAGALLTIGTVIVGSLIAGMDNATMSTKALTEAQKRLADIFQVSANGVVVLSDKFAKLAETSENAARAQLTMALIDANNIIKDSVQSVTKLGDALGTWKAPLSAAISQMDTLTAKGVNVSEALKDLGGTYQGSIVGLNQLNQAVNNISESFGISADDALKLVQALAAVRTNANPDSIAALRDVTVDLSQKYGYANKSLSEFTGEVGKYSLKADQAAESTRLATEMLQGHKVASEADAEATAQNTQRLQTYIQMIKDEGATIAMTARQKALYRAEQMGASEEDKKAINSSFDKIEAYKAEQKAQKDATSALKKSNSAAASQAKRAESQQESIAQKLEQLRQKSELSGDSTQELSREQSILSAQLSLGASATKEQIALAGQYAAKAYDTAAAIKTQQKAEKERQDTEKSYKQVQSSASPVAGIDNQFQQQMAALNNYAALYPQKIEEVEALRASIEDKYRQQREAAMWQEFSQMNAGTQTIAAAMDSLGSTASNAITGILTQTTDLDDALRSVGLTILNSVINSFVQMGVEWAKSAIMGAMGMSTASAATMAQGAAIAAAMAPAAAMTSLATAGANSVPAQAGITATVGLAQGLSVAGARYNGGPVSGSGLYQVGEKGKPEIFKASNGNQYMIPGDNGSVISNRALNGGSNGSVPIVNNYVINQSSGAQATTTSSTDGNGNVTIQTIVSDIEEGGPISQSISRNFATNRRATE